MVTENSAAVAATATDDGSSSLPLVSAEDYFKQLQAQRTAIIRPEQLTQLRTDSYQRGLVPKQVNRLKCALRAGEHLPDIILGRRLEDGKQWYAIVDGQQRVAAASEIKYPLRATIIDFGTAKNESLHFVRLQLSHRVNANHLCRVNSDNEVNREVLRISGLKGHPLRGKVFFGSGNQLPDQLQSTQLTGAVTNKRIDLADLEKFTRIVGTIWPFARPTPKNPASLPYFSGSFRGLMMFYKELQDQEPAFDYTNEAHVKHMQAFDWSATHTMVTPAIPAKGDKPEIPETRVTQPITATARLNKKDAGAAIARSLMEHWKNFKG